MDLVVFYSHVIQVCLRLSAGDHEKRISFVQLMIELMDNNVNMILFTSDEVHFHLNGYVNKQNCHCLWLVNTQQSHEKFLHTKFTVVWCAMGSVKIIGLYSWTTSRPPLWIRRDGILLRASGFLHCGSRAIYDWHYFQNLNFVSYK